GQTAGEVGRGRCAAAGGPLHGQAVPLRGEGRHRHPARHPAEGNGKARGLQHRVRVEVEEVIGPPLRQRARDTSPRLPKRRRGLYRGRPKRPPAATEPASGAPNKAHGEALRVVGASVSPTTAPSVATPPQSASSTPPRRRRGGCGPVSACRGRGSSPSGPSA